MFFSVLLLISLAVVLNVSFSSATTVNQTNITNSTHYIKNSSQFSATSSLTSNKTMSSNSLSNLSNIMAAGAPITVNGLTVAQLNEGISRVQAFYTKNGRLPNYVNYGTRQIPIATFQQNIATAGLKLTLSSGTNHIDTSSISALAKSLAVGSTSQYETAVKIFNWVRDNVAYSFYYNTKYGAAGTLISRTGNCCDKTNLLVALARAAGITAIYKSGYCQFSSGSWYGHVWADLYINGVWYPADSISSRNSLGVINNWNTATFTLYGTYTTLPF